MITPSPQAQLSTATLENPNTSSWYVYSRLLGYAMRYKRQMIISLLLSVFIAASFSTLLLSMGAVLDLTFYAPDPQAESPSDDPKFTTAAKIQRFNAAMQEHLGIEPFPNLEASFMATVDRLRQERMHWVVVICVVVMVLAVLMNVAQFFQEYFAGAVGANISSDLGQEMYQNLMRQPISFFESQTSGEILSRFTNDIFMVNRGLSGVLVKLMREPFKVIAFLGVAIAQDFWLTVVGLCAMPPVAFVLVKIGKKMRRSVKRSLQKIASMASVINETVSGIMIVKGYNMEPYEMDRVKVEITRLRRFLLQMVRLDAATGPITQLILLLGVVLFVLLSAKRVEQGGDFDGGDLTTLFIALGALLDPIRKLSSVNNQIQTSLASADRVFEYIDAKPSIQEAPDAIELAPMKESLRFENVSFSYNGHAKVLDGINLEVKKGEMVALVGFSGAGKSTLVKLIPRFYDATEGSVKIDGVDIRNATFRSLREQIGIVTQDTFLFAESIRENIAYGRKDYSDERVRHAAKAANAAEFIEQLPGQYDAQLGETGGTLSGGQRQRLAIARAIIKDPAILILDEATSSLDSESERLIQQALNEFVEGRTTVVIAHRLSTIQRADRIVVLDKGRIAEQGTHEELIRGNGIYRRLYETQFGAQEQTV